MRCIASCSWWVALLALCACENLSNFEGTYQGAIIDGNFLRRCFAARTRATLEFDPDAAVVAGEGSTNTLTTSDGTFDATPLIPFSALPHDQLSRFDFPGPSRLRNFLLMARPETGPLAGRDAVVVISLLESGSVEVRVMARTAADAEPCASTEPDNADNADNGIAGDGHEFFGVFQLKE